MRILAFLTTLVALVSIPSARAQNPVGGDDVFVGPPAIEILRSDDGGLTWGFFGRIEAAAGTVLQFPCLVAAAGGVSAWEPVQTFEATSFGDTQMKVEAIAAAFDLEVKPDGSEWAIQAEGFETDLELEFYLIRASDPAGPWNPRER